MASLFNSFSNMANSTVIPMVIKLIETNEKSLEDAIVAQLIELKNTNQIQFNGFLANWRKINLAIERASSSPVVPAPIPAPLAGGQSMGVVPSQYKEPIESEVAGTRKRRNHKKRTHRVKHRTH